MSEYLKYLKIPSNWRYVKLDDKVEIVDLTKLVRHQECYLLSEDNELIQENTDGSIFILGKIQDIMIEENNG